jgi:hypothetical protein
VRLRWVVSRKLWAESRPPKAADIQQPPKQASPFSALAAQEQEHRRQAWAALPLLARLERPALLLLLLPPAARLAA